MLRLIHDLWSYFPIALLTGKSFKIGIVGGGPARLYCALLEKSEEENRLSYEEVFWDDLGGHALLINPCGSTSRSGPTRTGTMTTLCGLVMSSAGVPTDRREV